VSYYVPKTQKGVFASVWAWVISCLILTGVIILTVWGLKTAFAGPAGRAGAFRQKEDANNRIFAQQTFEQEQHDFFGYLTKIRTYVPPLDSTQQTELEGLRQQCINVAQQYNADSQKYLLRDFKSAGLPRTLNASACLPEGK